MAIIDFHTTGQLDHGVDGHSYHIPEAIQFWQYYPTECFLGKAAIASFDQLRDGAWRSEHSTWINPDDLKLPKRTPDDDKLLLAVIANGVPVIENGERQTFLDSLVGLGIDRDYLSSPEFTRSYDNITSLTCLKRLIFPGNTSLLPAIVSKVWCEDELDPIAEQLWATYKPSVF